MSLLPQYRNMLAFIDPAIHEFASGDTERKAISGALYDLVHEHAKSICILLENKLCASAFTLIRSLFETFVRASWLLHCATEKELQNFVNHDRIELESKRRFPFGDMIRAVEEANNWPDTLSVIKNRAWTALNSYTHGGKFQVTRRYDGRTIQSQHDPEQVEEVVRFSAMISFLAFCEISEMSDNKELQNNVSKVYDQISQWCFGE